MLVNEYIASESLLVINSNVKNVYEKMINFFNDYHWMHEFEVIDKKEYNYITIIHKLKPTGGPEDFLYQEKKIINITLNQIGNDVNILFRLKYLNGKPQLWERQNILLNWLFIVNEIGESCNAYLVELHKKLYPKRKLENTVSMIKYTILITVLFFSPIFFLHMEPLYPLIITVSVILFMFLYYVYWDTKNKIERLYTKYM